MIAIGIYREQLLLEMDIFIRCSIGCRECRGDFDIYGRGGVGPCLEDVYIMDGRKGKKKGGNI